MRHAGTFHVIPGTWSRAVGVVAAIGQADSIYSNTAASGYFHPAVGPTGGAAGGIVLDEGVIPSTGDPFPFALGGPGRDRSWVTEVRIGYCDHDPAAAVSGWRVDFYESYQPCTYPPVGAPVGTVVVNGAPSNGCWVVDVDLTGGAEFEMLHDGDGFHGGGDHFGVAWSYAGTGSADAGLLLAGDPASTDTGWSPASGATTGSNTYYGEVGGCPGAGSGYRALDAYWVEDRLLTGGLVGGSSCYFFGGYLNTGSACGGPLRRPFGAHWLELSGEDPTGGSSCLCASGCVGAVNSTGVPGTTTVSGSTILSANDVTLTASDLPANQLGIFVAGIAPLPPGALSVGNGYLCIAPTAGPGLGRFHTIHSSGATGSFSLSTATGAWSVQAIPGSSGSHAAVAGTTTHFQAWYRDGVGMGSNITGSALATWQ